MRTHQPNIKYSISLSVLQHAKDTGVIPVFILRCVCLKTAARHKFDYLWNSMVVNTKQCLCTGAVWGQSESLRIAYWSEVAQPYFCWLYYTYCIRIDICTSTACVAHHATVWAYRHKTRLQIKIQTHLLVTSSCPFRINFFTNFCSNIPLIWRTDR
jgi:hypothetical protein